MADHPYLAGIISRLFASGKMCEARKILPSREGSRVSASYFFADEEVYAAFLLRAERAQKSPVHNSVLRIAFSGDADEMPLASLACFPHFAQFQPTHAVSVVVTAETDYRIVRRRGHTFFKFFTCMKEALREAAIHKFLFKERPENVVPYVGLRKTVHENTKPCLVNHQADAVEVPICLVTRAPEETHALMRDVADLAVAKRLVTDLVALLTGLFADHGFVHGDIHGCNVLVTDSAKIVLLDFGMSEIHGHPQGISGVNVAHNSFSERDLFMHVINDRSPDSKISRADYVHHYDLGRAVMKTATAFEDELAKHFMPGFDADDPWLRKINASQFKNHFVCAYHMLNARRDNIASDRIRVLVGKRRL